MSYKVEINTHSSIKFIGEKIIYFDPFRISENFHDADLIFITHDHYDHYDEDSIKKIIKEDTKIIVPTLLKDNIKKLKIKVNNIVSVLPNNKYVVDNIEFKTIPSYNTNKSFHPKEKNWVGYIVTLDNEIYYIAGDTDVTSENKNVKADVILIPIGGTYTMDVEEASYLTNIINPKIVIPTHYGSVVGYIKDGEKFKDLTDSKIICKLLIK